MSTEQIHQDLCANEKCCHPESNHIEGVCSGSLICMCNKFIKPILHQFAQEIEKEKMLRRTVEKRCEFILEKIPQTRNAGEKSFAKIYWEIWEGFKIRKGSPQALDSDTWKRLTPADTINRAKRKCKQFHEGLRTYDKNVIEKQAIIFQAVSEWATEN